MRIKKGEKSQKTGYILTEEEYNQYIKDIEILNKLEDLMGETNANSR